MKQLLLLAVGVHIIGMALLVDAMSLQEDCEKQRGLGNTCEESEWVCKGSFEEKRYKISYVMGGGSTKTQRNYPCKCRDVRPKDKCESWKKSGYCTVAYTMKKCCKTCRDGGWYSGWSKWSTCTKSCGGGTMTSTRQCNNPDNGGMNCTGGPAERSTRCNQEKCPGCTDERSSCGVWKKRGYCKQDSRYRKFMSKNCCRTCTVIPTNTTERPVNGGYSEWSQWSTCTASCGSGMRSAVRRCDSPAPSNGGSNCIGSTQRWGTCMNRECAVERISTTKEPGVDGGYGQWSAWSVCTKTCGGGMKSATRQCNNPTPSGSGRKCSGESERSERCNEQKCPGCVDNASNCAPWKTGGYCSHSTYTKLMEKYCCKTCNMQGGK